MRSADLVLTVACAITITCTHAKIGYFWHITDFHYDPLYTSQGDTRRHCRRADERGSSGHHRALGRFGDYSCDSPLELIESAARHMRTRHSENVEFVLWTGDIIAAPYSGNGADRYQAIRNMTDLLSRTFSSHFVFPVLGHLEPAPSENLTNLWMHWLPLEALQTFKNVLGHLEPVPSENLTNLWMHWLPLEALQTFKNGGYYTIEQSHSKLRIVALNTNLFATRESSNVQARRQWDWLETVLDKASTNKEMVYIVGHAPPGSDTRHGYNAYSSESNAKYLRTVRKYARIIAGQFFGHLHADTFRVVYDNDRPVSWAMMAPSVSPRRDPAGSSNPGLRLYKFDTNTGKVLDYTQYYLDLAAANRGAPGAPAEWAVQYNLTQHYGLHDVSAHSLHNLADRLRIGTPHETVTFHKYLRAYYNAKQENNDNCDGACAHQHFCAITCLETQAYRQCVEAAASALAAAGKTAQLVAPLATTLAALFALMAICL